MVPSLKLIWYGMRSETWFSLQHAGRRISIRIRDALNSAEAAFLAPRRVHGGVQINRFGIAPVGLLGNWVADHNGGSVRVASDEG